ncbi:MAG: RNA polymerase sigma factor [Cellulosilyticaceae bacterium]
MDEIRAEYLVTQYSDCILRIGYTWFNNLYDAQDVCQTVLMKMMNNSPVFEDEKQERAWIIRVTINTCKNVKKSAWFRRVVSLDEVAELTVQAPEMGDDSVLKAVQRLPLKYRQVIYLHYYEGYEVKEIASLLAIKPALVSTHLARGKEKLKKMLGGVQYGEAIPERA